MKDASSNIIRARALPKFPVFESIQLGHREAVENITSQFLPYSDFSFTSMVTWDTDNSLELSDHNGNLVIKMPAYVGNEIVLSVLGKHRINATIDDLLDYSDQELKNSKLELIPESVIDHLTHKDQYTITESTDHHDYVLSVDAITTMKGQKLKKKRHQLNRFLINHPNHEIRIVSGHNQDLFKDVAILNDKWLEERHRNKRGHNADELIAIQRALRFADDLELTTMGCYVEDVLVSYAIVETVSHGYGLANFEKALLHYPGSYVMINQVQANYFKQEGCSYINIEQDLGVEGLRASKSSWSPVKMLKKYTLEREK